MKLNLPTFDFPLSLRSASVGALSVCVSRVASTLRAPRRDPQQPGVMEIQAETLALLEWARLGEQVAGFAGSCLGANLCRPLQLSPTLQEAQRRQADAERDAGPQPPQLAASELLGNEDDSARSMRTTWVSQLPLGCA